MGEKYDYIDIESALSAGLIPGKINNIWTITNSCIICYNTKNIIK